MKPEKKGSEQASIFLDECHRPFFYLNSHMPNALDLKELVKME